MRVGFITSDCEIVNGELAFNGTGWYRCKLPASRLAANGHQVVVTNSIVQHPDGSLHPVDLHGDGYACDVIVLQRWMKIGAPEAILKARAAGQTVINDIDDWFLGIPTSNQAFVATHPRFDRVTQELTTRRVARLRAGITTENRSHYFRGLGNGDAITVSTEYLGRRMQEHFDVPIAVLRNPIDLNRFKVQEDVSDGPVVGWTGGIPWRGNDLATLRGVLGPFLQRHDLRFVHGGHHRDAAPHQFAAAQLGIDPKRVELREIVPLERYRELWYGVDIAVVPLELNGFNKSKSCLKGLESGACGIPFIASPSPEYEWLGSGLLAKRPKHWIAHFERLMDPAERQRIGGECRARSERESIDVRWREWEQTFRDVVALKAAA